MINKTEAADGSVASALLCRVFGHKVSVPTDGVELCDRCGSHAAYYLDGSQWTDEEREGLVGPLRRLWFRARSWTVPRCDHCRKCLLFRRRWAHDFCSKECQDRWIPF